MNQITIIVPVYNAVTELTACVKSVLLHTRVGTYRLLLVDDKSTDPYVLEYFTELTGHYNPDIHLLRNSCNLGFVKTANLGMSWSPNSDIVLLNSDTLVTHGWLDKIVRCASSDERIGTITPFSNNAEICSFPDFCVNNLLENLPAIAEMAEVLAGRKPSYPEIPTAVGFCMFIRRQLLNLIGNFDEETFGLGYGEENDFSLRAVAAGFRNVLCDDAFVAHLGGRSFDEKKSLLMAEHGRRLLARYPYYDHMVQQFIAEDPIKAIRQTAWTRLASGRCAR